MRRSLAFFLLGAVAGATTLGGLVSQRLDQLYWDKQKLSVQLFETTERLHKIESQWLTHREGEITAVMIELEDDVGSFVELELRRLISEITSDIVGEKVEELNPHLVINLLHQRPFVIDDKEYLTRVNWIVVGKETVINLSVSPGPGPDHR